MSHALTSEGHDASEDGTGRGTPMTAYALRKDPGGTGQGHNTTFVAAPLSHGSNPNSNMAGRRREDDENLVTSFDWQLAGSERTWIHDPPGGPSRSIGASKTLAVQSAASGVRRLTPTECERLQALPDDWTNPAGDASDSRRYGALGDAVTASVAEWIGSRLSAVSNQEKRPKDLTEDEGIHDAFDANAWD